ncbi:hypothetical protein Nepgr_028249 [Nepenthes gracilis]|uniref:Uncharacterized protein n=1 Tax=Nepenthes gracilis TaxID=150966 RepID=A0AAD3TCS1_NEPGR|nr:hypothetical protein Nepgr_028249 [Nepenthes gracilis]
MLSFCRETVCSFLGLNQPSEAFHRTPRERPWRPQNAPSQDAGISPDFASESAPNVLQSFAARYAAAGGPTNPKEVVRERVGLENSDETTVDGTRKHPGDEASRHMTSRTGVEEMKFSPPFTSSSQTGQPQPKKSVLPAVLKNPRLRACLAILLKFIKFAVLNRNILG